ncbi:hypothetical protein Btru_013490 [Bulinus truncatus]|nr:hypothetical protein Btru_013490 [Bulinus truncatus]
MLEEEMVACIGCMLFLKIVFKIELMAESLRGNLGLKSSPLAPTACKLSTQYLVLDHMTNHYNKIAKARSVIDTKPPKSLSTSQKMRDRRNRELHLGSPRLQKSLSRSHSDLQRYQDVLDDEPEDEESRVVHSIMKATLFGQPENSNKATYGTSMQDLDSSMLHKQGGDTHMGGKSSRPFSARSSQSLRSVRSGHSMTSMTSRVPVTTHDPCKVTYQGDLLDKRPHLFTDPGRAFTPRTLRANHESKLKNSKWYNPPKRSTSQSRESTETKENLGPDPEIKSRKNKPVASPKRNFSEQDLQDTSETAKLSESMLMDITLRSREEKHLHQDNHMVPPLAISVDQDHMNWLQEQASKAEVRARSKGQLKSSLHSDEELHGESFKSKNSDVRDAIKLEKSNNWPILRSVSSQLYVTSWISKRLREEDEEQKYLNFAKEVTDDVRSRGISADSVLQRVFENHIERRKHELDEDRMRKVIKDLKRNLGIPDFVPSSISSYSSRRRGSQSSNFQNESSKSFSVNDDTLTSAFPDDTFSSVLPRNNFNGHSGPNSTLDSTSTIKFGKTGDMLSTISSEVSPGNRDEHDSVGDENELTATQVLTQYQFDLTAKDAGEMMSCDDTSLADSSQHLSRIERPATGERRSVENEDKMSDSGSVVKAAVSSVGNHSRAKRREQLKKAHDLDISPSLTSHSNSYDAGQSDIRKASIASHDTHEENHSEKRKSSVASQGIHEDSQTSERRKGSVASHSIHEDSQTSERRIGSVASHGHILTEDVIDDDASVKSSLSSSRPVAKPRSSRSATLVNSPHQSNSDLKQGESSTRTDDSIKDSPSPEHRSNSNYSVVNNESHDKTDDDYEEDFIDEGNDADDDDQGSASHRTSDEDF